MTALLLIRHGENDYVGKRLAGRLPGVHLNEKGRKQAEALVPALQKAPIKAIYSSPLERAQETAEPLAQVPWGWKCIPAPDLNELDMGDLHRAHAQAAAPPAAWKVVLANPSTLTVSREARASCRRRPRAVEALEGHRRAAPRRRWWPVFTHADVIRLVDGILPERPAGLLPAPGRRHHLDHRGAPRQGRRGGVPARQPGGVL